MIPHLHPTPDYLSDHIRETGQWFEADILAEVTQLLNQREPGVIIDAGAMIGNHSAYLAQYAVHTFVYAFEPIPANLELLRKNLAPYQRTRVMPIALSDHIGTAWMAISELNFGHAMISSVGDFRAPIMPLDVFAFSGVSLLKIDVEGHEPQVLAGARETIARDRPLILIEDWQQEYRTLLTGYERLESWPDQQTYLYGPK